MKESKRNLVAALVQEALKLFSKRNETDLANYFALDELQELIAADIESNSEIPLSLRSFAVRKALTELKKGTEDPDNFFDLYSNEITKFRRAPFKKYYFVGTISSNKYYSQPFTQILKDERTRISIAKSFPKKIRGYSNIENDPNGFDSSSPEDFSRIIVSCYARSAQSAGLNALRHIDNLLGWMNLCQNRRRRPIGQNFLRLPMNHFILGPQQTLHLANGHRIESIRYEEPDKEKCIHSPFRTVIENSHIIFVRTFYQNIQNSPVRRQIENAIRAYLRATESRSPGEFLINLWACLELLFSPRNRPIEHKILLQRIKNIHYTHQKRVERVLLFAFHNRNVVAHQSQPPEQYITLFHSFRLIVEQMIIFTAQESSAFKNESDWLYFVDLPRNQSELERRRKLIGKLLSKLKNPK